MQKRFFIVLTFALFGFFTKTFAQENKFAIGIEAGPSYNFMYGNKALNKESEAAIRYYSGFSFQYNFRTNLSLQSGLAYERKGDIQHSQLVNGDGRVLQEFKFKDISSYVTVPLLLRANFGQKPIFFINIGPYMGYALSHIIKVESSGKPFDHIDRTSFFKRIDLGLTTGAGLEYSLNPTLNISMQLRNNSGLLDCRKPTHSKTDFMGFNSFNLLAGLSYKFRHSASAN